VGVKEREEKNIRRGKDERGEEKKLEERKMQKKGRLPKLEIQKVAKGDKLKEK
jgi:hypothetical protein